MVNLYATLKAANHSDRTIESLRSILETANTTIERLPSSAGSRTRRTGKDLVAFKKSIKTERKSGVSVAELAEKYGVTPSYIYQLR